MTKKQEGLQWYPRYVGDYARKTKHLTMLEHGAYTLLLDYYYATGEALLKQCSSNSQLMPDHCRLYRLCGAINKEEQQAVDNVLEMFFVFEDGGYINKKANETIALQLEKHKKRVDAGKQRWEQKHKQCSSNALAMHEQPEPEPEPDIYKPPTPLKEKNGVLKNGFWEGVFRIEDFLSDDAWQDARSQAPKWDIHLLCSVYNEGINSGKRQKPNYPNKAFPAWCKKYTKGKEP